MEFCQKNSLATGHPQALNEIPKPRFRYSVHAEWARVSMSSDPLQQKQKRKARSHTCQISSNNIRRIVYSCQHPDPGSCRRYGQQSQAGRRGHRHPGHGDQGRGKDMPARHGIAPCVFGDQGVDPPGFIGSGAVDLCPHRCQEKKARSRNQDRDEYSSPVSLHASFPRSSG